MLECEQMNAPAPRVDWFFGRGLSIGCGLTWSVPIAWRDLQHDEQIDRIKNALRVEMDRPSIDCSDIRNLLCFLSERTVPPWRHLFITTNWDFLLQREVLALGHMVQPPWSAETHVYHLNGTVEELPNNQNRSRFILETDPAEERVSTIEADIAFNNIIWNRTFVVIGMSFECEVDKFILKSLARVQDDLPIGESEWIIVNPDAATLATSCERIQRALPRSSVHAVAATLRTWLNAKTPELQACGSITS
jgi:hypothetical protein